LLHCRAVCGDRLERRAPGAEQRNRRQQKYFRQRRLRCCTDLLAAPTSDTRAQVSIGRSTCR
jgi:hypothetical protein